MKMDRVGIQGYVDLGLFAKTFEKDSVDRSFADRFRILSVSEQIVDNTVCGRGLRGRVRRGSVRRGCFCRRYLMPLDTTSEMWKQVSLSFVARHASPSIADRFVLLPWLSGNSCIVHIFVDLILCRTTLAEHREIEVVLRRPSAVQLQSYKVAVTYICTACFPESV